MQDGERVESNHKRVENRQENKCTGNWFVGLKKNEQKFSKKYKNLQNQNRHQLVECDRHDAAQQRRNDPTCDNLGNRHPLDCATGRIDHFFLLFKIFTKFKKSKNHCV